MGALDGKKILVTREARQAKFFSKQIKAAGGMPVEVPLLKINCKKFNPSEAQFNHDWVIFTSVNGVICFLDQLSESERARLKGKQIAVVGHKTGAALSKYGLTADLMPEVYDAVSLAEIFLKKYQAGKTTLIVRGNKSRDVLPTVFSKKGIAFDTVEVYETMINDESAALLQKVLQIGTLDFITFTSPSTVEAFITLSGKYSNVRLPCVCIGTTTETAAKQFGFHSIITAEIFTVEGMIEAMQNYK